MEPSSNKKIAKDASAAIVKPQRRLKVTDIIAVVVFALIAFFLISTLTNQLSLKSEVSNAEVVTNQVVNDINKTDGSAANKLGDSTFQKAHTADSLTDLFTTIKTYAKGTPIIDAKTVTNDDSGQAVSVLYKYPNKPEFYISVKAVKAKGSSTWQLTGISGNPDRSKLISR